MNKYIYILLFFISLRNCNKVTYLFNEKDANVEPIEVSIDFTSVNSFEHDVNGVCGGKTIYKIVDYTSFWNVIYPIKNDKTILVYCN